MPLTLILPSEYPLICLACMIICLECYFIGMKVVNLRWKFFDKDFMKQFKSEHQKAFPG